jgi:Flp pilus assembly protein TadB
MSPDEAEDEDAAWADSADRRIALRALAEHRAEEHLSAAEHDRRRDLAERARTVGELRALFTDLPAPHPLLGEAIVSGPAWVAQAARAGGGAGLLLITGGIIVVAAILAGWWIPAVLFACLLAVATIFATVTHR